MASWVRTTGLYVIQEGDGKMLVSTASGRSGHRVDPDRGSGESVRRSNMTEWGSGGG